MGGGIGVAKSMVGTVHINGCADADWVEQLDIAEEQGHAPSERVHRKVGPLTLAVRGVVGRLILNVGAPHRLQERMQCAKQAMVPRLVPLGAIALRSGDSADGQSGQVSLTS